MGKNDITPQQKFTYDQVHLDVGRRIDRATVLSCAYDLIINKNEYRAVDTVCIPEIKNVIFNSPATIVYWVDGTKTVVKAQDEPFDPEKGIVMAIAKKAFGNSGNYFNRVKKWTNQYNEKHVGGE